jgi:hypothetical protein
MRQLPFRFDLIIYSLTNSKYSYSGKKCSKNIFAFTVLYNILCSSAHWIFTDSGKIIFLGTYDNSLMGWPSLFFAFAYGWALPFPAMDRLERH